MPASAPVATEGGRLDSLLRAAVADPDTDPVVAEWLAAFLQAEPSAERPQRVKVSKRKTQAMK